MQARRLERVNELLKRVLGEFLRREAPTSGAGLLSVNEVVVAGDLHTAAVYVTVLGSEEQRKKAMAWLFRERKRIQSMVAQSVVLKNTPQLHFKLDQSIIRGNRVLEILAELESSGSDQ
jgi:ribosome-binding factor A